MSVELLLDAKARIGESPTWVPAEEAVYWVDIKAPALHRLELQSRAQRSWKLPAEVGGFALRPSANGRGAAGGALLALRTGLHTLDFAAGAFERLGDPPYDPDLVRFNEGACDAEGRFWIGAMYDPRIEDAPPPTPSALHRFTFADGLRTEPDAADLHNGMAWSRDGSGFFVSHSQSGRIFAYAYDLARGRLGTRKVFATLPKELGLPDGAAVDVEDGYWCAVHGGGRLRRYRSDGTLDREVALPVSQPTMCAFVGADLDRLVVTSARDQLTPEELGEEPLAGGLFIFDPGVRGAPRNPFVA